VFGGGVTTEEFFVCDQYTLQGDAFSRALLEGSEVPGTIEDAIKNMAVIEAIFRSVETGQWEKP
jgi:predicted dehydrogenase